MHQSMAEEIFLAALLQDVGMLALDKAVPDLYRGSESIQRDHAALAAHEKKRLQVDHAEIGGWLMQDWNLPERLHRAIEHSHHIDLSVTAEPAQIFDRCVALSGPVADLFLRDPRAAAIRRNGAVRRAQPGHGQDGLRPGARHHRLDDCRRPRRSSRPIYWPSSIRS